MTNNSSAEPPGKKLTLFAEFPFFSYSASTFSSPGQSFIPPYGKARCYKVLDGRAITYGHTAGPRTQQRKPAGEALAGGR